MSGRIMRPDGRRLIAFGAAIAAVFWMVHVVQGAPAAPAPQQAKHAPAPTPSRPQTAPAPPELIPRAVLFSLAATGSPQLSPDGKRISYLKPSEKGVPNIWVRTIGQSDDHMVTSDAKAGIYQYRWSADGRFLLYLRDRDGDENFHLMGLELKTGLERDYTPFSKRKAQNLLVSAGAPGEVLIGLNLRDLTLFDMYRVNLDSGALALDTANPGDVRWWLTDHAFQIRAAVSIDGRDGHQELRVRDGREAPWRVLINWPFGTSGVLEGYGSQLAIAFSPDGRSIYVQSALHSDTTQLLKVDLAGGAETLIAHSPKSNLWNVMDMTLYDFAQVLFHPETGEPQAVAFNYLKPEWKVLDPALAPDFAFIQDQDSAVYIIDRSRDDKVWLIGKAYDDRPDRHFLYDRTARTLDLLFPDSPLLAKYAFAHTKPITFKARDGVEIPGYLTLPPGVAPKMLPLVLTPHGGPWARDDWGFNALNQLLANRGYAVLQVNFRGSDGYGRSFLNAGDGQWGVGVMQNDLTDAVKWTIARGIADPKRVGIMGGSYGGYATLAGLTFTPDLYACGIDMCGIANVKTAFETMPPFWQLIKRRWILRVGDAEHDDALNRRISPVFHVDAIRAPLLIGHGLNDPRVKITESEQIVAAMRKRGIPVIFVVYPDEGHGIGRPENLLDFTGRTEDFLAAHLGGRAEPGEEIKGSTAELK
jgi:dipeptidyl aminopeptidase/acylaminoacyl peptidase